MICLKCKLAGLKLSENKDEHGGVLFTVKEVISGLHRVCAGGTWCDCQHKITGIFVRNTK